MSILAVLSLASFGASFGYANSNNMEIIYAKTNSAIMGQSLKIEIYSTSNNKLLSSCTAKLKNAKFVCILANFPKGTYKFKFINDVHGSIWSGNKASYDKAESVGIESKFEFTHKVLNTGKTLKDFAQIQKFTAKAINIPEQKHSLTKNEVIELIEDIKAKTTSENRIYLQASATSNGELKDLKYNGYRNILAMEFLKINKGNLVIEMNKIKIGKMPFGGYAEVNVPFKNIYADSSGNIYIDYKIPSKLKEKNYIKVMGAKAKILQYTLSYTVASNEFLVYVYSKDSVMFAGEKTVEFFARGVGL